MGLSVKATEAARLGLNPSYEASLAPKEQARTWERGLQDAQHHLAPLLAPRTEPLSSDAIHAAHADLQAFYIHAYQLKDWLKEARNKTGISGQTIEKAIKADSDLALLADLANLAKHAKLSRPARSGDVPKIVSVRGTTDGTGTSGGWRLDVLIEHKGHRIDGLEAAKRALSAWHRVLKRWKLL